MNVKTTAKEIRETTPEFYLFKVGYCDLQNTLRGTHPVAHTCGIYGWNFDVYKIGENVLETGYRRMDGIRIPGHLVEQLERTAAQRWEKREWKDYDRVVEENLKDLIEVMAGIREELRK